MTRSQEKINTPPPPPPRVRARTSDEIIAFVGENWEWLHDSGAGWRRPGPVVTHYLKNPAALELDIMALEAEKKARKKADEFGKPPERQFDYYAIGRLFQELHAKGLSHEEIQEATAGNGTSSRWSLSAIRLWCSVPLGENPGMLTNKRGGSLGSALQAIRESLTGGLQ